MKRLHIALILSRLSALESLMDLALHGGREDRPAFLECLQSLIVACEETELEFSVQEITPLYDVLSTQSIEYKLYADSLGIIRGRITHELAIPRFFHVPREKLKYYEQKDTAENSIKAFGPAVDKRFGRRASRDIDEAGKCYALGRNTACVFHLMRIIEVGLESLQKRLKVTSKSPNWNIIIRDIQTEVDKRVGKNPTWKKPHQFYSDVLAQLRNIKDAWRNPVMHVISWHDEESAANIYAFTKAFMQRMARSPRGKSH
jgi:hypothetical protein